MSSEQGLDTEELTAFGETLTQSLLKAEEHLRTLGHLDGQETPIFDDAHLSLVFEEISGIDAQIAELASQLANWKIEGLPVHQKSEIDWLESRLGRLNVVTRNSLRIGRRIQNLPDPEREHEEMLLMLNTISIDDEPLT